MLSANDAVEMIRTEGSDIEEDDNASDDPYFDANNAISDVYSDTEVGAPVNNTINKF